MHKNTQTHRSPSEEDLKTRSFSENTKAIRGSFTVRSSRRGQSREPKVPYGRRVHTRTHGMLRSPRTNHEREWASLERAVSAKEKSSSSLA